MPATTEASSSSSASGAEPAPDAGSAPVVRRLAAFLTDLLVVWPVPVLLLAVLEGFARIFHVGIPPIASDYSILALLFLEFLYFAILEGCRGQSLGKAAFGLEVRTRAGDAVTLPRAAARTAVFLLLARGPAALILVALGPRYHLWAVGAAALFGASGLHEVATATQVGRVPERAGAPPTARRLRDLLCPLAVAAVFLWPFVGVDSTVLDDARTFSALRTEAEHRSVALLADQGYDVREYERSTTFWEDDEPFKYLRKNLGWQRAWAVVDEHRLPLAGWRVRFFRPLRDEEFTVWWALDRRLIGFRIEAAPRAPIPTATSQDVRRAVAGVLRTLFPAEADRYALVAETTEDTAAGPARAFVWRQRDSPLDLRLYLRATAVGTEVRALSRVAEVPESFARSERDAALRRSVLNRAAWSLNSGLSIAVMVFLLLSWQRGWLRPAPILWIAGIMTALRVLSVLNEVPLYWSAYSPRELPWVFWLSTLSPVAVGIVLEGAWTAALLLAADAAGRLRPHGDHSLADLARPRFYLSEACVQATIAGLVAVLAHRMFVDLFYGVLVRDVAMPGLGGYGYSDLLSTRLPWLKPILSGAHTALTEEAAYRLFAISLLLHWTRWRWIALGAPAVVWAFLHSWYAIEPIYARGIELTAVALLYGALYLRFGIWATIVAHFSYNAWVTSGLVEASGDPWLMLRTLGMVFLPSFPMFLALGRQMAGRWPTAIALSALAHHPQAAAPSGALDARRTRPQIPLNLPLAAGVAAVAAVALAVLPGQREGASTTVGRGEAIEIARAALSELGHDLQGFRAAATIGGGRAGPVRPSQYVWPSSAGGEAVGAEPRPAEWTVRFFAPRRADECTAHVGRDPAPIGFQCRLDDSRAAQPLDVAGSRHLAEQYLKRRHLDPAALRYAGSSEQPQMRRIDHVHRWMSPGADGAIRTFTIGVSDGRIASFASSSSAAAPAAGLDHWARAGAALAGAARPVAALVLLGLAVQAWLDRGLGLRSWDRRAAVAAAIAVPVVALDALNYVPARWMHYDTATALHAFAIQEILAALEAGAESALVVYGMALLSLALLPNVIRSAPGSREMGESVRTAPWKWYGSRGGFAWAVAIVLLQALERKLVASASGHPVDLLRTEYASLATAFPAGQVLVAFAGQLLLWAAVAVGAAAACRYWRPWLAAGVALLWITAVTPGVELGPRVTLLVFVLAAARFHVPFYFWYSVLAVAVPFLPWLVHGSVELRWHGRLVWIVVGVLIVMLAKGWRRRRPSWPDPDHDGTRTMRMQASGE